jgi:transcriptional regulator with XRE-family HTH domain
MPLRTDRLKEARERLGYSQVELAERLDIGIRMVHRYEKGLAEPSSGILARIARELEVTSDYLLGLSDTPRPTLSENELSDDEKKLITAYRLGKIKEALQLLSVGPESGNQSGIIPKKKAANG